MATVRPTEVDHVHASTGLPLVSISSALAEALGAKRGDLVYVTDRRAWLGGLRSTHAIVGDVIAEDSNATLELGPGARTTVIAAGREDKPILLELLY